MTGDRAGLEVGPGRPGGPGPVADRAIFHTDNAYFLSDVEIVSYRCRTHTQSNTAFRGFGGPQGVILIEAVLGDIARALQLDPQQPRALYEMGKLLASRGDKAGAAKKLRAAQSADAKFAQSHGIAQELAKLR